MESQKLLLFFLLFFSFSLQAQHTYSYVSERKFKDPTDLAGYSFRPSKMEIPGSYDAKNLAVGSYSFGISRNRLLVNGDTKIGGLYEINNITPTDYGYKLELMNSRNPAIRGHFKVILNKRQEAEVVVFKAKNKASEIIFHLPEAPQHIAQQEKEYFTDLREVAVEDVDSLWGSSIFPYLKTNLIRGFQDRLYMTDSTHISFIEKISIKEKKKKIKAPKTPKASKKKKKKNADADKTAEKEIEKNKVGFGSTAPEIRDEKVETAAAPIEEEEEGEEEIGSDTIPAFEVKEKILKEYFFKFSTILKNEEGVLENKTWEFPVKEVFEREDESAGKNEERFQVVIRSSKKKELYLYLYSDRTISSFELDGIKYLMRGH